MPFGEDANSRAVVEVFRERSHDAVDIRARIKKAESLAELDVPMTVVKGHARKKKNSFTYRDLSNYIESETLHP